MGVGRIMRDNGHCGDHCYPGPFEIIIASVFLYKYVFLGIVQVMNSSCA